jgi:hypothetical protein
LIRAAAERGGSARTDSKSENAASNFGRSSLLKSSARGRGLHRSAYILTQGAMKK